MGKKHRKSPAKAERAGVDTGHQWRDLAEPLFTLASGPLAAELIAGVLNAGAEALVKGKPVRAADHGANSGEDPDRKSADLASLVGYAVAVAASVIATRIIASYEREMGNTKTVRQTASAARRAAEIAWTALGKKGR